MAWRIAAAALVAVELVLMSAVPIADTMDSRDRPDFEAARSLQAVGGALVDYLRDAVPHDRDVSKREALAIAEEAIRVQLAAAGLMGATDAAASLESRLADLRTARELLDVIERSGSPLETGLAIGSIVNRGSSAGPAARASETPLEALETLAFIVGHPLSALDRARAAQVNLLDPALKAALSETVDAFVAFYLASEASVELRVDSQVLGARQHLLRAALELNDMVQNRDVTVASAPIQVPPVFSIDLDAAPNVYPASPEFALMIDAGGNDVYLNNAGGTGIGVGPCVIAAGVSFPAATLIDLGGFDRYGNPVAPRSCGANGGGFLGAGFLLDVSGDDEYWGGEFGTNGGGSGLGTGFLADLDGDDFFDGLGNGTNGGLSGVVVNVGGSDEYRAHGWWGNGAGGFLIDTAGFETYAGETDSNGASRGFLFDLAGDDHYEANGFITNGAAGFLFDGEGSDRYLTAGEFSNGGLFGALVDVSGEDEYVGTDVSVNGGDGLLLDGSGDDRYEAGSYGTNGGGFIGPRVIALLLDLGGNDVFVAGGEGTNGGCRAVGVIATCFSALVNFQGTDSYAAIMPGPLGADTQAANGGAVSPLGSAAFSALLDFGGSGDSYTMDGAGAGDPTTTFFDATTVPKGLIGMQLDLP